MMCLTRLPLLCGIKIALRFFIYHTVVSRIVLSDIIIHVLAMPATQVTAALEQAERLGFERAGAWCRYLQTGKRDSLPGLEQRQGGDGAAAATGVRPEVGSEECLNLKLELVDWLRMSGLTGSHTGSRIVACLVLVGLNWQVGTYALVALPRTFHPHSQSSIPRHLYGSVAFFSSLTVLPPPVDVDCSRFADRRASACPRIGPRPQFGGTLPWS